MSTTPPQTDSTSSPNSPPQNQSSGRGKGCLIGCGLFGILGALVCCGGVIGLFQFYFGAIGDVAQRTYATNPAIQEHIGQVESVKHSWLGTMQALQERQGDENILSFDIKGNQGEGKLLVIPNTNDPSGQGIESATLILQDGSRIPLTKNNKLDETDAADFDLDDLIDPGQLSPPETAQP